MGSISKDLDTEKKIPFQEQCQRLGLVLDTSPQFSVLQTCPHFLVAENALKIKLQGMTNIQEMLDFS